MIDPNHPDLDGFPISSHFDVVLGTILREKRESLGISQTALALGVSKSAAFVSFYERGLQGLTVLNFCHICGFFQVAPTAILRLAIVEYKRQQETLNRGESSSE